MCQTSDVTFFKDDGFNMAQHLRSMAPKRGDMGRPCLQLVRYIPHALRYDAHSNEEYLHLFTWVTDW